MEDDMQALSRLQHVVLDPCAGGNKFPIKWEYRPATEKKPAKVIDVPPTLMSYPEALRQMEIQPSRFVTNDIREDSPAEYHGDFLDKEHPPVPPCHPSVIITNPPFSVAMDMILRSFEVAAEGGFIVMLLRLNFFGSAERFPFFASRLGVMPKWTYVHHKRMGFLPDGSTDSIEYAHLVWQKGNPCYGSTLKVI
jgi:hypothetical protein